MRHFNQQFFKLNDFNDFAYAIFDKVKDMVDNKYLIDLSENNHSNIIELVTAFKLILIKEDMQIENRTKFREIVCIFCNLVKIKE